MAKCLNKGCDNEVVSQEGKRARRTCSDSCRQQLWQKNNTKKRFIKVPIEEWEKLMAGSASEGTAFFNKAITVLATPVYDAEKTDMVKFDEAGQWQQSKKNEGFRPRKDSESGMEYRIAKEEWSLNNQ